MLMLLLMPCFYSNDVTIILLYYGYATRNYASHQPPGEVNKLLHTNSDLRDALQQVNVHVFDVPCQRFPLVIYEIDTDTGTCHQRVIGML